MANEQPPTRAQQENPSKVQPQTDEPTTGLSQADDGYLLPKQEQSPAETKRRRRRGRLVATVALGVMGLILVAIAALIGFYAKTANDAMNQVQRQPSMMPQSTDPSRPQEPTPAAENLQPPLNVLIMGTDSRGYGDQGRSDVLMLAHVSGDRQSVYLISFPRDMWVPIPGRGNAKINAAYAWGGMPLAVQTVESLTGARIDHSGIVDFEGFVSIIDAIGGIEVYNFAASGIDGYTFPAGPLTLDGKAALVYTRERVTLPHGDLDRARRQRDVVIAVTKKLMTPEVLADPGRFSEVINLMAPYFTVDDNLTNARMIELALQMRYSQEGGLRSLQAPISGFGSSVDGQSIDIVDPVRMAELSKALTTDTMATYWEQHQNDPPLPPR